MPQPNFIPALRFPSLTRFYDRVLDALLPERAFKARLSELVADSRSILDLGCGTGTLTLMLKLEHEDATVTGVDADPLALSIAREKSKKLGVDIRWFEATAVMLPLQSYHFECAVSSLMLHHLTTEEKEDALTELYRVLKPGGILAIADWDKPQNVLMSLAFLAVQLLDGFTTTADARTGRLPLLIEDAGFVDVRQTDRWQTAMGSLSIFTATRPPRQSEATPNPV